jgi:hypothetical protein
VPQALTYEEIDTNATARQKFAAAIAHGAMLGATAQ